MKTANAKPDADRWLDGEISMGRLIHNSSLETCYAQAADCIGGVWQAMGERAYALDAELERRIKFANGFKKLADEGDRTQVVAADSVNEAIRAHAFQEARTLLRTHLLACIDRTGCGPMKEDAK